MAASAFILPIVNSLLPQAIGAIKKDKVVDTTPDAPDYVGPDSFAEAFQEEKTPYLTYALIAGGCLAALFLIWATKK